MIYSWWFGLNLTPSVPLCSLLASCSCWTLCDSAESSVCGLMWGRQGPVSIRLKRYQTDIRLKLGLNSPRPSTFPRRAVFSGHFHTDASSHLCVLPCFICDIIELKPRFFDMYNKHAQYVHYKWVVEIHNTKAVFFFLKFVQLCSTCCVAQCFAAQCWQCKVIFW